MRRILAPALLLLFAACGRQPDHYRPGPPLNWVSLRDVAHLQAEVARASAAKTPVVVDAWATW